MLLTPMRYKDYIWPHNPATYSIAYVRNTFLTNLFRCREGGRLPSRSGFFRNLPPRALRILELCKDLALCGCRLR